MSKHQRQTNPSSPPQPLQGLKLQAVLADQLLDFPLELIRLMAQWLRPWTIDDLFRECSDLKNMEQGEYEVHLIKPVPLASIGCTEQGRVTFYEDIHPLQSPFVYEFRSFQLNGFQQHVRLRATVQNSNDPRITFSIGCFDDDYNVKGRMNVQTGTPVPIFSCSPVDALLRGFLEYVTLKNVRLIEAWSPTGQREIIGFESGEPAYPTCCEIDRTEFQ